MALATSAMWERSTELLRKTPLVLIQVPIPNIYGLARYGTVQKLRY